VDGEWLVIGHGGWEIVRNLVLRESFIGGPIVEDELGGVDLWHGTDYGRFRIHLAFYSPGFSGHNKVQKGIVTP